MTEDVGFELVFYPVDRQASGGQKQEVPTD